MKKPSYTLLMAVLAVDLLATTGDITSTWTSPVYPILYSNDTSINPLGRPITSTEDSWIGSIINLGSFFGAIPAGLLADKIGRKWALLLMAIPHVTAYLTFAFATTVYWYLAARFWSGIAVGVGYALMPMYIVEISEDSNRGSLSATLVIFWCLGIFLPVGIGPYLSIRISNLIYAIIPALFFIVFLWVAPESPEYLVHKGRIRDAEEVLKILRDVHTKSYIDKEILKIKEKKIENGSFKDVFKDKTLAYGFLISIILIFIKQFSGTNALGNYTQLILDDSNTVLSSKISSPITGLWNVLWSIPPIFLVERLGRKVLLLVSLVGCALSTGMLGVFYHTKNNTGDISSIAWLPLVSFMGFILFFNIGLAPVPWTFSSEIFPNNVKAITSASISAANWVASFLVTQFFNSLNECIGEAGTFWIFSGFCVFGTVFSFFTMPETKGKSYIEIYAKLSKKINH